MKEKVKKLYYAVSARGQGVVFTDKPVRVKKMGCWSGTIEGCYCSVVADMEAEGKLKLPSLKYDNDPVELKLSITYGGD